MPNQQARVKHIFDKHTLSLIINALVFSKMYYCSSVWPNTSKKNISKLQSVQNFAARVITGIRKYDHVTPILQQLAWLSVECMLKLRDAVITFKCMKGLAPPYLCDKFEMRSKIHSVNTRNKDKLVCIHCIIRLLDSERFIIAQCLFGMSSQIILKTLTLWTGLN